MQITITTSPGPEFAGTNTTNVTFVIDGGEPMGGALDADHPMSDTLPSLLRIALRKHELQS